MLLDEFVKNENGKGLDFDGAYGYQCMDLIEEYNKNVIGAPRLFGNAIDMIRNPQRGFYDYYINSLTYVPPRGAIAVWNKNVGNGFGHVAIVLSASLMKFTSLDQNWPVGSFVHAENHSYINVHGFMVPRVGNINNPATTTLDAYAAYKSRVNDIIDKTTGMLNTLK